MREIQELTDELRATCNLDDFWNQSHAALRRHGVTSIFYGALATRGELTHRRMSRSIIWKTTHPQVFVDAFGEESLLDDDYTVEHCVNCSDVLFWQEDETWKSTSPKQRARARIERDLGLRVGATVPASCFAGNQIGGVGIAMADVGEREFRRYWRHAGRTLVGICGVLDAGMREQHIAELIGLSGREKECLVWLASGLRPDQIADRLNIGGKSVEKYIAGSKRKLKAATRDHAVAKALVFGLIDP